MGTPLGETHERATIDRMINDQLNHEAKGMKIPTAHNLWSWMPLSNNSDEDRYQTRKKNDDDVNNSVSDVESQDTC